MKAFCSKKRYEYWGRVSTRILPLKSSTFLFTYVGNGLKPKTRNTPQYPHPPKKHPRNTPGILRNFTSLYSDFLFFFFTKIDQHASEVSARERAGSQRTRANPPAIDVNKSIAVFISIRVLDNL